jgi:hypothetical protein
VNLETADLELPLRPKRWARWAMVMLGLGALYIGLWLYPKYQISTSRDAATACLAGIEQTGVGDPRACAPHPWLARALPWTRAAAAANDAHVGIAMAALELASTRDLDATARDRAAEELRAGAETPYLSWAEAGALRLLAAEPPAGHDEFTLREQAHAATLLGDTAALKAIVEASPSDDGGRWELWRAELLCVFGEPHEASLALGRAHDGGRMPSAIDALCNPATGVAAEPASLATGWLQILGGHAARALPETPGLRGEDPIALLDARVELGDPDLAHFAEPMQLDRFAETPNAVLAGDASEYYLRAESPARDDRAAAWIATKLPSAHGVQRAGLAANAAMLALHASGGWIRRGELAKARASLEVARAAWSTPGAAELTGFSSGVFVPYLLAAGDVDGAAQMQATETADARPSGAARVVLHAALVLVAQGKDAEAFAALEPAVAMIHPEYPFLAPAEDALWLRVALAAKLGKDVSAELPVTPDLSAAQVQFWWRGARESEAARATRRTQSIPSRTADEVLPQLLYLEGRLAGSGDVEAWLDKLSGDESYDPIRYLAARAEAATWRGDAAAAKRWTDRLAKLRALVTDDRGDFLLHALDHV